MNRRQAAREARALVAEWIWQILATDDESWRECYGSDVAKVVSELQRIETRFEGYGPSLFHRLAAERRTA